VDSGSGLRDPRVARVFVLYVLARVPASAVWLSVVLDVSAASGSYAKAGGAVGAYGLGVAAFAPVIGRLADRCGARRVLLACIAAQLPALLLLSAAAHGSGLALLAPAFVAGMVQPPLVACMRASWTALVSDEQALQRCFAFDSVLGEVVDLAAPLIAVAVNVARGPGGSLVVVAVVVAATSGLYACVAPVGVAPAGPEPRPRARVRPALPVLLVVLLLTAGLGAVEVSAVALADGSGDRAGAGLLLALFTCGSIAGGVLHARRPPADVPSTQLLALLLPLGYALLAAAFLPYRLWLVGPLLVLAGGAVAPLVTVLLGLIQSVAVKGAETETFTYATTANFVGVAAGSALAGVVGDLAVGGDTVGSGAAGLLVAVCLVAATGVAVLLVSPALPEALEPDAADDGADEPAAHAPVPRQRLVEELERTRAQARELGLGNDELARELARLRGSGPDQRHLSTLAEEVRSLEHRRQRLEQGLDGVHAAVGG